MTYSNGKPKLQRIMERKLPPVQQKSIAELLNRMHPDDPMRPIVEAMADVQDDVVAVRSQLADSEALKTTGTQGLSEAQFNKVRSQLKEAIHTAEQALSNEKSRDYTREATIAMIGTIVIYTLAGGAIGSWVSEGRSAEARRYWDWNQGLIAECQKQNKPTCNIHVVPPEQW